MAADQPTQCRAQNSYINYCMSGRDRQNLASINIGDPTPDSEAAFIEFYLLHENLVDVNWF